MIDSSFFRESTSIVAPQRSRALREASRTAHARRQTSIPVSWLTRDKGRARDIDKTVSASKIAGQGAGAKLTRRDWPTRCGGFRDGGGERAEMGRGRDGLSLHRSCEDVGDRGVRAQGPGFRPRCRRRWQGEWSRGTPGSAVRNISHRARWSVLRNDSGVIRDPGLLAELGGDLLDRLARIVPPQGEDGRVAVLGGLEFVGFQPREGPLEDRLAPDPVVDLVGLGGVGQVTRGGEPGVSGPESDR